MTSQSKKSLFALLMFFFSSVIHADDIDILTTSNLVNGNILFVMDLSGSMNIQIEGGTSTRLEELSGAFQNVISDNDFSQVNFGLSVFSGDAQNSIGADVAHGITYPVSPVIGTLAQDLLSKPLDTPAFTHPSNSYMPVAGTTDTRQYLSLLSSDTNIWSASGGTPIVDALYEAARYFRGEDVLYGRYPESDIRSAHPSTYTGSLTSVATVTTIPGTTYQSEVRDNNIGGTNCSTVTGNKCGTNNSNSCGLGTNCFLREFTRNRTCADRLTTVAACQAVHPDWYDFTPSTKTECAINELEESVCTDITFFVAKEDIKRTICDAPNTFRCDFPVTTPSVNNTEVVGNAVYKSPITQECAANSIILLTDGAPTDNHSADEIAKLIGSNCNTGTEPGRCGAELAKFMHDEDHADGSRGMPDLDGLQNVKTYAVGLALDLTDDEQLATKNYLDEISNNGNGNPAIIASNQAELTTAFKNAINDSVGKARSFSSPSYTVDTSTLLTNGPYVYIPVFDQSNTLWPGNLKKYKIVKNALTGNDVLTDADGNPAIDPLTGGLSNSARDLWSGAPSTDAITSGGAANKIDPDARKIYTDNNGNATRRLDANIANNYFGLTNTPADTNYKNDLITFIKGKNPSDGSIRNHMGDIIHSKPIQLSYAGPEGRKLIFVGTNEGYLHAINDYALEDDARNGTESYAYMPKELLKNIKDQYSGVALPNHIYGVDGEITLWLDERENPNKSEVGNNILDHANGEKAYLFFGLRRGGGTYTALDVTDPDSPEVLWSESFGTGNSWSQPLVTTLIDNTDPAPKPVVIIGGGFNDDDDGNEIAGGNNVYVIDALTGTSLWDASDAISEGKVTNYTGTTGLPNAVPAKIRAIDLDRNNSVDRLYFGDTGGNVWRIDLNAGNFDGNVTTNNDLDYATVHRIAALGGADVNNRQFFEELDVAIFNNGGKLVTSIAIGSGSRPNPLSSTVEDKFFLLYDKAVTRLPTTLDDPLITVTGTVALANLPLNDTILSDPDYIGWQKPFNKDKGEKVLSSSLTFQGKVLFNTFAATSIVTDVCSPSNMNENKLYVIDLKLGIEDLVETFEGGEILETPKIFYPSIEDCKSGDCERVAKIANGKLTIDVPPSLDGQGNVIPASLGESSLERVYWINSNE